MSLTTTITPSKHRRRAHAWPWLAAALLNGIVIPAAAGLEPATAEQHTAAYFEGIAADPPALRMFLQAMPKGADLHSHLGGSVFAEDYLRWADEQGLCLDAERYRIAAPPCDAPGRMPARGLVNDAARYGRAIDALSVRGFERGVGDPMLPGHERFFGAFEAFIVAANANTAKAIAAARETAALDRIAYLELMAKPGTFKTLVEAAGPAADTSEPDFAALTERLAPLLPAAIERGRAEFDAHDAEIAAIGRCGSPTPAAACKVEVRYLVTARRNQSPSRVFAELLFGFALVEADPRFVGVNIAAPEHDPITLRDYALQMRMFAFLKQRHPNVPLSLHAGELTLGQVAPRDLAFHIRDAVMVAGAKRIGHGADIAYETDAAALLQRMARDRVAVEINLSSNAVILGIAGRTHPLALYRAAGVPVLLSTDDRGVLRTDLTHEYQRAVEENGLRYADLKHITRDTLHYAFVPGASLWQSRSGGARVAACAASKETPDAACARFLDTSAKARLQWRLERDLAEFESRYR